MLIATISMGEPLGNFFLTAIYAAICGGGQRSFCKYANYFFKAASSNFLSNRFNWCRLLYIYNNNIESVSLFRF